MSPLIERAREWLDPMRKGVARARTLGLAAEMSFWLFLSLVPLAAVAGLVAAKLASQRQAVANGLLASVPPDARAMIATQVHQVAALSGRTVAPLALGMFVWLAASGVHSVFDALEVQSGAERPWWKKRLLAIATCIGLSFGVGVLGLIYVGLGWVQNLVSKVPHPAVEGTIAGAVFRTVAGLSIAVGMVAALYRVGVPREARARVPVWPGAVLAVALIALLGGGYGLYVSTTGTGDAYQGSLAVIGITLMTLWLFSLALLLGAELNHVIAERRAGVRATDADDVNSPGEKQNSPGERQHPNDPENETARKGMDPWPTTVESSSRPTSPTPPSEPSTGPSRSPRGLVPRSR